MSDKIRIRGSPVEVGDEIEYDSSTFTVEARFYDPDKDVWSFKVSREGINYHSGNAMPVLVESQLK